jgi:uncharacterized protein (TIGR00297 family)
VAFAAWRARALTGAGAVAAAAVGAVILEAAGWAGGAVLLAFFISSSAVSRAARADRLLDAKGDRRDAWQVLANGGPAAIGGAIARATLGPGAALWVVTGALAAAAADTWASSLGSRSAGAPRHVLTGLAVAPGTSGGISLLGTAGAAVGAALTAVTGAVAGGGTALGVAGSIIGVFGMLADSVLGAAVQGRFQCLACGVASEWPVHHCGATTAVQGGWTWLTNDGVNAIATALGAMAGLAAWAVWSPR